jgi:hypothetical protein
MIGGMYLRAPAAAGLAGKLYLAPGSKLVYLYYLMQCCIDWLRHYRFVDTNRNATW